MWDRMPPEKLARAKQSAALASDVAELADLALGKSTRVKREKARAELERRYGRRQTERILEQRLQFHGARPKGWRRLFS